MSCRIYLTSVSISWFSSAGTTVNRRHFRPAAPRFADADRLVIQNLRYAGGFHIRSGINVSGANATTPAFSSMGMPYM